MARRRRATAAGSPGARGSASSRARSARWPGRTVPRPPVLAARASAAVSECSGYQAASPGSPRWTAAAIASQGSSRATGASEPRASRTPASISPRSGKLRAARCSPQIAAVTARSSSRWAGCTLATSPRADIRPISDARISCACSMLPDAPVPANASTARTTAASPMACRATERPARPASPSRSSRSADATFCTPWPPPEYGSQQWAVRVPREPSEMILSDPMVSSGWCGSSSDPVRRPAASASGRSTG